MRNFLHTSLFLAGVVTSASAFAQTATVTLSKEHQIIRGIGACNHPTWTGYDLSDDCLAKAFGTGEGQLGFSILRIWIDSNSNNWYKEVSTSKKVINNYGGIVFATPWNPPTELAETVTRNNRSEKRVIPSKYAEYAAHLNKFNDYMTAQGAPLYAISYANEPDYGYDWTWWSADEVYNFAKNNAGSLRRNGAKVITHESFAYNKSYYNTILNDATCMKNLDILGTHFYASSASSANSFYQYDLADQKNMERWMTEHYTTSEAGENGVARANMWPEALDVAYEMHRAFAIGNFSAYVWWYLRRSYGPILQDDANTISKRGYLMGQYARFIRPGYVRVDATENPTYNVYVSAFKKDNDVVIVAVNRSTETKTLTFSIPGTKVTSWEKYVTSGTKNMAHETAVDAPSGSFQITLDAQSTTTFVGKGDANAPGTPVVELTSPVDKSGYVEGDTIVLSAEASVENGEIKHVDFYANGEKIVAKWLTPRTYNWVGATAGKYKIWAIAYDSLGNSVTSDTANITVNVPQAPYSGTAAVIPGVIEAEDYDLGGEGYAYHDEEETNRNGGSRDEGVDTDSKAVGYTKAGEWMEYTVNVAKDGLYRVEASVASGSDGSAFQLFIDNEAVTDTLRIPNTGDWTTYVDVADTTEMITEGEHVLKLLITGSWGNIDKLTFTAVQTAGIGNVAAADPVVATEFYNLRGQRVSVPEKGVYMQKTVYESGRVEFVKVVK